jgi:hypothetical protein
MELFSAELFAAARHFGGGACLHGQLAPLK